jgi:hypothetical protein
MTMRRSIDLAHSFFFSFFVATTAGVAGCSSPNEPGRDPGQVVQETPAQVAANGVSAATHAEAAAGALKTLAHLATAQRSLGLRSESEAASASVAEPLAMFMVGLEPLRLYRAGDEPRALLVDEGSFLYPVTAGGDVRGSVVVRKAAGGWKATQFGRAALAKAAVEGRSRVAATRGVAESAVSVVEVPALLVRLLGHDENGILMLTATGDVPGTDIHAGTMLPAADMFVKLQPSALRLDDRSPN